MELVLDGINEDDAGDYECIGSNTQHHQPIIRVVTLKVESSPVWVTPPQAVRVEEGGRASITCNASAVPDPIVTWLVDGTPITELPADPRRELTSVMLTFSDVTLNDSHVVQCNASNKYGFLLISAYISVHTKSPSIVGWSPGEVGVLERRTVRLPCDVFGAPSPQVTWSKDGEPITDGYRHNITDVHMLQIQNTGLGDSGTYVCTATNTHGSISKSINVSVSHLLVDVDSIKDSIMNPALSSPRSHQDGIQKLRTKEFIKTKLQSLSQLTNLTARMFEMYFSTNDTRNASNVVWVLPGMQYGTPDDKPLIICTHYDTVPETPGVDDNGSGVAVLLEVAAVLAQYSNCPRPNSIILVAFDAGSGFMPVSGSETFIEMFMVPTLMHDFQIPASNFQGVFIIACLLNYDNNPNSQKVPHGFGNLLPSVKNFLSVNSWRGDFLAAIGRQTDQPLLDSLQRQWTHGAARLQTVNLPFSGIPSLLHPVYFDGFVHFMRGHQKEFWGRNSVTTIPTVFLTDTADFRGYMETCYEESCDDVSHVTESRIDFLAQTASTLARAAISAATEADYTDCISVTTEQPEVTSDLMDSSAPTESPPYISGGSRVESSRICVIAMSIMAVIVLVLNSH